MTRTLRCADCGLQDPPTPGPCPSCGAVNRNEIFAEARLDLVGRVTEDHVAHGKGPARELYQVQGHSGWEADHDLQHQQLAHRTKGAPAQNEADTVTACERLTAYLNEHGGNWESPQEVPADSPILGGKADCIAAAKCGNSTLAIQVTRIVPDGEFWRTLGSGQEARDGVSIQRAATVLYEAVEKKGIAITDANARSQLTLVLNLLQTPGFAFDDVVGTCIQSFGPQVAAFGFAAVWVVGPPPLEPRRLDASA